MWMTFNHLKTNSTKLAHYRLKLRKVIELFEFQSLMQHPLFGVVGLSGENLDVFSPLGFEAQTNSDNKTQKNQALLSQSFKMLSE